MVNEQINIGIQVVLLAVTDPPENYEDVVVFPVIFRVQPTRQGNDGKNRCPPILLL